MLCPRWGNVIGQSQGSWSAYIRVFSGLYLFIDSNRNRCTFFWINTRNIWHVLPIASYSEALGLCQLLTATDVDNRHAHATMAVTTAGRKRCSISVRELATPCLVPSPLPSSPSPPASCPPFLSSPLLSSPLRSPSKRGVCACAARFTTYSGVVVVLHSLTGR